MNSPDDINSRYREDAPDNGKGQAGDAKKAFSERYSFCVKRLGKTDSAISAASGIPRSAIGRYRAGEAMPEARYVFPLADALGVSARWLLTGIGDRFISDEVRIDGSGEGELLGLFRSLHGEAQKHLLQTARLLWSARIEERKSTVAAKTETVHEKSAGFSGFEGKKI